jgi:acetyltransferase-like isoleucine patch superfamily enzyme
VDLLQSLRTRWALARIDAVGRGVQIKGLLWFHGGGQVRIGDATLFDGGATGIELYVVNGGCVTIGARCRIGEGVSIEANESVVVGDGVSLGPWCKIIDNNFHPLHGDRHRRPASQPVVIEDDVKIGAHVIVLPGVRIARGAQVRDEAVVTRAVPANAVVGGNPARRAPP